MENREREKKLALKKTKEPNTVGSVVAMVTIMFCVSGVVSLAVILRAVLLSDVKTFSMFYFSVIGRPKLVVRCSDIFRLVPSIEHQLTEKTKTERSGT